MHGKNNTKTICIAGKNKCAIDALSFVLKKYKKYTILSLPNSSDDGLIDGRNLLKNLVNPKMLKLHL